METAEQSQRMPPPPTFEPTRLPEGIDELDELLANAQRSPRRKWDLEAAVAEATTRSVKLTQER